MLHPEFQSVGHHNGDQASKSYNYSKIIWGVLKTAAAIIISSKYNSTRLIYLHINLDNLYFKNWGSIGVEVQLLSNMFLFY